MTTYHLHKIASVQIGSETTTAIIYVQEKIASNEGGDLVKPRTVANSVAPLGVMHVPRWWEITVGIDEAPDAILYLQDLLGSNDTYVTTLAAGAALNPSLIITQNGLTNAGVATSRTITFTNLYVKNYSQRIATLEEHQPFEVTFLSYGTRTETAWT